MGCRDSRITSPIDNSPHIGAHELAGKIATKGGWFSFSGKEIGCKWGVAVGGWKMKRLMAIIMVQQDEDLVVGSLKKEPP